MKITLYNTANMFGLTTKNLKLSAMQTLLRRRGIIITYLDSTYAVLESANGLNFDASFQQEIEEINKKHAHNLEKESTVKESSAESNNYSWSVFNGFMIALGVGVMATALVILSGASLITAAVIGIGVSIGAMLTYGLFKCASENEKEHDNPSQLRPCVA